MNADWEKRSFLLLTTEQCLLLPVSMVVCKLLAHESNEMKLYVSHTTCLVYARSYLL